MATKPTASDMGIVNGLKEWVEALHERSFLSWTRYVKSTGLSMPQAGVLMHLYHKQGCGVSEIGGHMDITNASASQLVDRLVSQGLVERREDSADRRVRSLSLTPRGRELVETGIEARLSWVEEMVGGLDEEGKRAVRAALPPLIEAARSHPASHPDQKPVASNKGHAHTS